MNDSLLEPLRTCANEIRDVVHVGKHEGYSGQRATQYHLDLAADDVAIRVLTGAGFAVMSEESGMTGSGDTIVVVDPIDGSTNCDQGIPFFATSLAIIRNGELVAGLVMNQATGTVYEAEVGAGATRDGESITASGEVDFASSIVAFSGLPKRHAGWAQYRALGAASLEVCLVADGSLDLYSVANSSTLNPWDYLGGLLIASEAGAVFDDLNGDELITAESVRRRPVFAATKELVTHFKGLGNI